MQNAPQPHYRYEIGGRYWELTILLYLKTLMPLDF